MATLVDVDVPFIRPSKLAQPNTPEIQAWRHAIKNLNKDKKCSVLVFIGEGSKILNKNSIYLENEFNHFSEINYYNETKETICESACNFERFSITNHFNYFTKNP